MLRPALRTLLVLAALAASVASAMPPQGYSAQSAPGITVITPRQAAAAELTGHPVEMRFGDGENGTALMVRFLREAHARGASYLADVEIHLADKKDGLWQECVTRIVPADHGQEQTVTSLDGGHYETQSVMRPVTQMVTEYEYRCQSVSRPQMVTETSYESSYDFSSKSYQSHPVTRTHTEYRYEQECHNEAVSRMVTRYEYQLEHKFVPPQWHTELRWMSAWKLDESKPVCAPLDRAITDPSLPHFVRATAYAARK
jgi:hypothetical protein